MGAELTMPQFAVWARRGRVQLPYPLEISEVPGAGVHLPDSDLLDEFGDVMRSPRISAFALHSHPDGRTDCYVAVASGNRGVFVTTSGTRVTLEEVADTELAKRVVEALPLPGGGGREAARSADRFGDDAIGVPDVEWNAMFGQVAHDGATAEVLDRFDAAGLPTGLAHAMADAVHDPVAVGVLGASAWLGGEERIGPHLSAWFEYPAGAIITEREPSRGRRQAVTWLHGYSSDTALRVLALAVGAAGAAVDTSDESSLGGIPLTLGDDATQAGAPTQDVR